MKKIARLFLFLTLSLIAAAAEDPDNKKNELGLTIGAEVVPGRDFQNILVAAPAVARVGAKPGSSVVFGFNYARRIKSAQKAALYLEVPIFAGPSHSIAYNFSPTPSFPTPVSTSLATLYVTPSLRVKFRPEGRVSPWLSAGGGYAFYEASERLTLLFGPTPSVISNPRRNTHTGALQFGGGVDFKTPIKVVTPIHLRAEIRDFHTFESVNFGPGRAGSQDNLVFAGGIILKF